MLRSPLWVTLDQPPSSLSEKVVILKIKCRRKEHCGKPLQSLIGGAYFFLKKIVLPHEYCKRGAFLFVCLVLPGCTTQLHQTCWPTTSSCCWGWWQGSQVLSTLSVECRTDLLVFTPYIWTLQSSEPYFRWPHFLRLSGWQPKRDFSAVAPKL